MRACYTVGLLLLSNVFMTLAWYGHLKWFPASRNLQVKALLPVVLVSWGIAFFEYWMQVPANRLGYAGNGGPFSLFQLKVLQEVLSLSVFALLAIYIDPQHTLKWNHVAAGCCLLGAVYFIFSNQ